MELADWCAISQHVGGAGMAEAVGRYRLLDASGSRVLVHDAPDRVRVHAFTPAVEEEVLVAIGANPLGPNAREVALH
jgi:hypothetical protein